MPAAHRTPQPVRLATVLALTSVSVFAAIALAIGGAYGLMQASPTIAAGVSVAGLSVGGLSMEQASSALDGLWNRDFALQAVDPPTGRAWAIKPAEIGLSVDAPATAKRAYAIGREGNPVASLGQAVDSLQRGAEVRPTVVFDADQARRGLERLAELADLPAVDASLWIEGGEVHQTAGIAGRDLDIQATLDLMAADPSPFLLDYGFLPLLFKDQAPAIPDASSAAETAEKLLSASASLQVYDPVLDERLAWTPSRVEVGSWLPVATADGVVTTSLDAARLRSGVEAWASSLGEGRTIDVTAAANALQDAIHGQPATLHMVHYLPTRYVSQRGETLFAIGWRNGMPTWKMQEYNPEIGTGWLAPGTEITLPPKDALITLPVVPGKRIIISISQQRLWTYENGALRSEHVISTGIDRSPTLPGLFQVTSHVENAYGSRWNLWMPHFLGIYDALPGFTNGIHGLPLLSSGVRLWGDVLGRPASFGCIILDLAAAEEVYVWAEDGVVVEIRR